MAGKTTMQTIRRRLEAIGYGLDRNATDAWGKRWTFKTFPQRTGEFVGGSTCYHADQQSLARWIERVEGIRAMWQGA